MKENTCSFSGHRKILKGEQKGLQERLKREIATLILAGYDRFITGGAVGFDTLAASEILLLKEEYPNIKLQLALPYEEKPIGWSKADIAMYDMIKEKADEVVFTSKQNNRGCYHVRNRYLIDNSSVCIAYQNQDIGGTAYTVRYAESCGVDVINIADI